MFLLFYCPEPAFFLIEIIRSLFVKTCLAPGSEASRHANPSWEKGPAEERSQHLAPACPQSPAPAAPREPPLLQVPFAGTPVCTQPGEESADPAAGLPGWPAAGAGRSFFSLPFLPLIHVHREPRGTNNSICRWIAEDFNESAIYLASSDTASTVTRRGTE